MGKKKCSNSRQLSNNTKFYFSGDTSVLGGLLNNVLGGN